jgi:hypothetical protein
MRKALSGLATWYGPDGIVEQSTFTCVHCNAPRRVKPYCDPADLGGLCRVCMGVICERCVGSGCDPLEEKIKRVEHDQNFDRWFKECR